jgi:hypothetical protein
MIINKQIVTLIVSLVLLISVITTHNVYSRTDEEADEQTGGGEQRTPSVFTDPSSSDSLSLLSHRISRDTILDTETLDINGEIQNNGTEPLNFVKVTATFYDVNNSVLGNDYTFTKPYTLEPGQSAPFRLNVGFRPATNTIPINEIASIKLYISGE